MSEKKKVFKIPAPNAIDEKYLSQVLKFGDVKAVKDLEIKVKGNVSNVQKIQMSYKKKGKEKPKEIVVKMHGLHTFGKSKWGHKADVFSLRLLNDMNCPFSPKLYYSKMEKNGMKFIAIMESLKGSVGDVVDFGSAKKVVTNLAKFQSTLWNHDFTKTKIKPTFFFYALYQCNARKPSDCGYTKENQKKFRTAFSKLWTLTDFTKEEKILLEKIKIEEKWKTAADDIFNCKYQTMVHGDFRSDNIILMKDGTFKLIDFQMTTYGCPLLDFANYTMFGLKPELFDRDVLLKLYYNAFDEKVKKSVSFETISEIFDTAVIFTFYNWMYWNKFLASAKDNPIFGTCKNCRITMFKLLGQMKFDDEKKEE